MSKDENFVEIDTLFKVFQKNINRKATYNDGIINLLELREKLMDINKDSYINQGEEYEIKKSK